MSTISFNYLKSIFSEEHWDLGVISGEDFKRASLHPIKYKFHPYGDDYTNHIHFTGISNVLVLVRDGDSWDYTHYQETQDILYSNGVKGWYSVYTNFKEAAILAGLGVRAKNSLIYSYKFGFDHHIAAVRFVDDIVDLPTDKRVNYKIWNRCEGCNDCAKACPANAIHYEDPNPLSWWLDSSACEIFMGLNNHEEIPSTKEFWGKYIYPHYTEEDIKNMVDHESVNKTHNKYGLDIFNLPFNRKGFSTDGQVWRKYGKAVTVPICRECTSQPRCSKWNGKYPYDKVMEETINLIELLEREKYSLTIAFTLEKDDGSYINLEYGIFDTPHSKLWLDSIKEWFDNGNIITDTDRVYNFNPSLKSTLDAIDACNDVIKNINIKLDDNLIPSITYENLQSDINHIHTHFVDSDRAVEYTQKCSQELWSSLNAHLHGLETIARHNNKEPQGQIFIELQNQPYFDLPESSYQFFTIKKTFGYCYANYAHVGRHIYELFQADDNDAHNDHIVPMNKISGSSHLWFGKTTPALYDEFIMEKIKIWYEKNNISNKINMEWGDPHLAIGWLPVAKLKNNITEQDLIGVKKVTNISLYY